MAVSNCARSFSSFECRSDPGFPRPDIPCAGCGGGFSVKAKSPTPRGSAPAHGLSSLIFKFPPNFVRQLSYKARRNCGNIGVAQVVAASWSENQSSSDFTPAAKAVDAAVEVDPGFEEDVLCNCENVPLKGSPSSKYASFLSSDGSIAIHAGKKTCKFRIWALRKLHYYCGRGEDKCVGRS